MTVVTSFQGSTLAQKLSDYVQIGGFLAGIWINTLTSA
jgi:hypothetical protein